MKRRTKVLIVTALAAAFLLAGVLPLTLLALPNPPEFQQVETAKERGAYAEDDGRLIRLYPHPRSEDSFPDGAVRVGPGVELQVHSRQYDELARYRLVFHGSEDVVAVDAGLDGERVLHVAPRQALEPGRYQFESVKDSMYGEEEFYYFEVVDPTAEDSVRAGTTGRPTALADR